ncbi:Flagellar filament 30.7 kDa core protein [Clostridium liquoris]|uniref:Flagellar filament 30.7 kDa core protein n=1 Tax=Clostridium liquoris TaxID=1289519 RepID=A0A2T0B6F8_9CLOT|nr:Flagellar filament 30.7 kDa core protein [Clostridium liquoris]
MYLLRITNRMMSNNFLNDMMINLDNLQTISGQLTSGKEIRRPSDDPFKVARAMQLHTDINTNKQYNENIKDTINFLDETDTALNQLGNQFQRVRELLVSAGGVYGTDERKKVKDEINEIIGQVSQTLNSNFDGKYIFGGTRATTKPTNTITGPATTKIENKASADGNPPVEASVNGKYSGAENIDYEVEVSEGKVTFTASNGKIITGGATEKSWDLENGLTFKADKDLVNGTGYKFTAIAEGNTKLIFNSRKGEELSDLPPIECKIPTDVTKWNGKEITFNVNGNNPDVVVEMKDLNTPEDIINKINSDENLKGKVFAVEVKHGKESSIQIYSLDENKVFIKDTGIDELKTNKFMGNYEMQIMGEDLITEISQGVTVDYNTTAAEIIKFNDSKGNPRDLKDILEKIVRDLDNPNRTNDITNEDLEAIDAVMDNILKLRSKVGAKQNRMDSAESKNSSENFDMTDILSKTEDINITEKVMQFAVAQTVYIAALQTSAKIIQPTLMDYLR